MSKKILFAFSLILVLLLSGCAQSSEKSELDGFAQCLSEKDATMYGADWCGHCKKQKALFGSSFKYVDYVECPANAALCTSKGIEGYPTWIINGTKYAGKQSLEILSSITGCELA